MRKRIIDGHAHIFPQKIAEKAVASIGGFYDLEMRAGRGTSEALLESGGKIGTERYLVCSTATRPGQVQSINDFILEETRKHPEFVGFATLHPEMEGLEEEFERILERDYAGIKLHPDFQRFAIDDEQAFPIYRMAAETGLFILFHTGDARYEFSSPRKLAAVTEKFPGLFCIAAHFGGYQRWQEAYDCYESPRIYMDTSSALFRLTEEEALRFFEKFGWDHFFWGTDFPMWKHEEELARFEALPLGKEAQEAILAGNFARVILKEPDGVLNL